MAAIYAARIDPPSEGLPVRYAADSARLQKLCEAHQMKDHPALRSVVREFLYDRKVILRPLAEPHLPLSNNAAEPGAAPLGDFAHHQPRNPLRSGIPRLGSSG